MRKKIIYGMISGIGIAGFASIVFKSILNMDEIFEILILFICIFMILVGACMFLWE